jgi:hypothetical protein
MRHNSLVPVPFSSTVLMASAAAPEQPYYLLFILWPVGFIGIWALWNAVRDRRDEKLVKESLGWPEAQGVITASRVAWAHVKVDYDYAIGASVYKGNYEISLTPVFPDQGGHGARRMNSEAKADITGFPPGDKVVIRYNPQRPQQSVLFCSGEISKQTGPTSVPPEFLTID